jgi:hypothetical protein
MVLKFQNLLLYPNTLSYVNLFYAKQGQKRKSYFVRCDPHDVRAGLGRAIFSGLRRYTYLLNLKYFVTPYHNIYLKLQNILFVTGPNM